MEVTKQHIADLLRQTGYAAVADEAIRDLPDPVELDRAEPSISFTESRRIP